MAEGNLEGIYQWDNRPQGTSWIRDLNASQAVAQCCLWGLTPASTLEENRVVLRNHIKTLLGSIPTTPAAPLVPSIVEPSTHTEQSQWADVVQATAQAVGSQIAAALAGRDRGTQQMSSLPHALRELVSSASSCTGTDSFTLLKFVKIAKQLEQLKLAENKQMLVALLPKTSGQLREMWSKAILSDSPMSNLLLEVVNTFLPDRARQQLLARSVYRVQGSSESLADFIIDIKGTAEILLPPNQDILEIVLTGINPPTRARLAGFPAPTHLEDLLALAPRMEVIRQLEMQQNTPNAYQNYNRRTVTYSEPRRPYYLPATHRQPNDVPRFPFRPNQGTNFHPVRPLGFRPQGERSRTFTNSSNQHRQTTPGTNYIQHQRGRLNYNRGRQ